MNTSILTIENKNFSSDSAKEKEPSTSALPRSSSPPDTWNPSLFLEQLSIPDPLDSGHLSPLSDVSTEYVYTAPKPLSTEVTSSLNPTSGSKAVKRRRTTVLPKKKNGRVTTTKKETNSRSHTPSFPSSFFSSEATTSVTNINVIDDLDSDTFFLSPETLEKIIKPPWDPLERRKRRISEISKIKKSLGKKEFDLNGIVEQTLNSEVPCEILSPFPSPPYPTIQMSSPFTVSLQGPMLRTDFFSPFSGRILPAFIYRDFETCSPHLQVLRAICTSSKTSLDRPWQPPLSIDYVYFQSSHLIQVNSLLTQLFWEGIDVSESLSYPEYGVVALYGKLVIGCALCTPEGYLSYLAVMPTYQSCGIASFMLYWLCQLISRDITLHVSANNPAMILYQKFGFKPEEYIVGFYDKYYPQDSKECKNAYFLRLRR